MATSSDEYAFGFFEFAWIGIPITVAGILYMILVGKRFPHHGAYAFDHCGKVLFEALRLLGVEDINTPLPAGQLYPGENPFAI